MAAPRISVVMPVYNAMPFLTRSIQSILNQTLKDFEFVILNNGSTDESENVLREWKLKDPRIVLYSSNRCEGLARSSNLVVSKARASLIARMDADDVCEPERLARQWEVLRDHPDVVAVGSLSDGIDADGKRIRPRDRWRLVRRSSFPPFPHGSVMFRRHLFDAAGGYSVEHERFEDLDLFRRLAELGRVVTLPEVLYHYRYHAHNSSGQNQVKAESQYATDTLLILYSVGAIRLWAGQPTGILKQVVRDRTQPWTIRRMLIAAWAGWSMLSPESLKVLSRTVVRIRDLLAGTRVSEGRFYEWRFK